MESVRATEAASAAVAVSHTTRVSLADIEASIAYEFTFRGNDPLVNAGYTDVHADAVASLSLLTICVIVMRNGFTVIGKSAPADAVNFNPELGKKFAREDAVRQLWPLMGYALRERLAA